MAPASGAGVVVLLSVPQAAAELGLSPRQVRRLARQLRVGELVSDMWVFTRPDVHRLRRRRKPGRARKAAPITAASLIGLKAKLDAAARRTVSLEAWRRGSGRPRKAVASG